MKIDDNKLQSVFLRPNQEQNSQLIKNKQIVEDFESFLKEKPVQTYKESSSDLATVDLFSSSFLGQLTAQKALSSESSQSFSSLNTEEEISGVLDSLEEYMSALSDPELTLKQIAPLAEELSRSALKLDKLAASMSQQDPLKELTNETATLAAVEALKFKRGDFV
ncbi:MAG: hypothetical protein LBT62_02085 [Deltaproteobacteria bacterium]|jgi:hypothetical protein|nr:hypothetical protein [Deltaproteobacteria bacterium]